jgi:hypothetical protein
MILNGSFRYIWPNAIYILNKNINASCKVLVPCFISWNKRSHFPYTQKTYFFQMLCTHLFTSLLGSISPLPRKYIHLKSCGISKSWLNLMIITQVHLVLGIIKGHSKMYSCVTRRHTKIGQNTHHNKRKRYIKRDLRQQHSKAATHDNQGYSVTGCGWDNRFWLSTLNPLRKVVSKPGQRPLRDTNTP